MTDSPTHDLDAPSQGCDRTFRVIPGDPGSCVILHVPHCSPEITDDVRAGMELRGAASQRGRDAMTDAFTDVIAERAADLSLLRPWIFVSAEPRLVVDPDLTEQYSAPYAAAFTDVVDQRLVAVGHASIVDLRSYPLEQPPYELHGEGSRPQVCLGNDEFHTPSALLKAARDAFTSFTIGVDRSCAACYVPPAHHRKDQRVSAVEIRLRRDLYMDEESELVPLALVPIVDALATLIADIDPSIRERP